MEGYHGGEQEYKYVTVATRLECMMPSNSDTRSTGFTLTEAEGFYLCQLYAAADTHMIRPQEGSTFVQKTCKSSNYSYLL